MKKIIMILLILLAAGCQNFRQTKFTILGEGTPYVVYPEILNGRVNTVVEKSFWAFPQKGSYIRGKSLSMEERINLGGWSDDFKAVFDQNSDLRYCIGMDESGRSKWKNEFIKEKNLITRTNFFVRDTLVFYLQLQYGSNGFVIAGKRFIAGINTILGSARIRTNQKGYPTEIWNFDSNGKPANKIVYSYDGKDRFVEFALYDLTGQRINSHEAKYNRKNKISEFVFRDQNKEVLSTNNFIYQYDDKGNWIRAIVKISKGPEKWFVMEERSYTYYP